MQADGVTCEVSVCEPAPLPGAAQRCRQSPSDKFVRKGRIQAMSVSLVRIVSLRRKGVKTPASLLPLRGHIGVPMVHVLSGHVEPAFQPLLTRPLQGPLTARSGRS